MILSTENPMESTKTVRTNKSVLAMLQDKRSIIVFLHTCNKQPKNETTKTVPFTIASRRIKCLGINLIKEEQAYTLKTTKHY